MWRRLRSKSMAPRRPAVFPEQWPLVALTAIVVLAGIAIVAWSLWK
jgi:hypothetical protein